MKTRIAELWQFAKAFWNHAPMGVGRYVVLLIFETLTRGIGILMLIPLLTVVGVGPDSSASSAASGLIGHMAHFFFEVLKMPRHLVGVLGLYVLLVLARELLSRRQKVAARLLEMDFVYGLRRSLYDALVHADWLFLTRQRNSDFMQVLTADLPRAGMAAFYGIRIASDILIGAVYLLLAMVVEPTLSLVTCFAAAGLMALFHKQMRLAQLSGEEETQWHQQLFSTLSDHLNGIKMTKSYGAEARSADQFAHDARRSDAISLRFLRNHTQTTFWFQISAVVVLCGVIYGGVEILQLPPTELLILVYLFARIMPICSSLQSSTQQFLHALPAYAAAEALRLHAEASAESRRLKPAKATEHFPPLHRRILLDHVSFCYGTPPSPEESAAQQGTLEAICVEIPARKTTAIIGPSGAGKSTLADILMGLIVPNSGQVMIDDLELASVNLMEWRQRTSYVPQDTFLFHDSIRNNLLWAEPKASDGALWQALQSAAAADFVHALPDKLDTQVGDRGIRLSGGERQRLALARALLRKPDLLILDEATSALDLENERHIQQALAELHGSLTIVQITHRLASVKHADLIVALDSGKVAKQGSWEHLFGDSDNDENRLLGFIDPANSQWR